MKKIKWLLLFIAHITFAQQYMPPGNYTSTNKKAIKHIEEARKFFESKKDADAEKCFLKALYEDPNFVEAMMGLSYIYIDRNKPEEAIHQLKKAVQTNPKFFPNNFYQLGEIQYYTAHYDDAIPNFQKFLTFDRINPDIKNRANYLLACSQFASQQVKNPKPFNPKNMGAAINTDNDEYLPSVTADSKYFYFTRHILHTKSCDGSQNGQEDFYFSHNQDGAWQPAQLMKYVNSPCNEGSPSVSVDGQFLFFVGCEEMPTTAEEKGLIPATGKPSMGSCDILFSQKVGDNKWTKPFDLGPPVCTFDWESQPSFSSDNKTLYFVRGNRGGGGVKNQDIYVSTAGDDGVFTNVTKLGNNINTPGREEAPFIHPDNQTLYFVSDSRIGMGGLDIYMCRKQADGTWGEAINLGYPINTNGDESSLIVSPDGKKAYFHSDKPGGFGGTDLYSFDLPQELAPQPITYAQGKITDAKTKQALPAVVHIFDLSTQQLVTKAYADYNGNFLVVLPAQKNYMMNVAKENYLFYSDNFSLKDIAADYSKPFQLNIALQPIDTGVSIELKNVFFDVDKYDLKPESKTELDKLVSFLTKNKTIKIEIGGHTDSDGNKKANQLLSQNRAKAVYDYVAKAGISTLRLSYKGYGDSKPIVPNTSIENKAKNRRTEVKITGK
ncbi:MAG: PD40 domain-containing protein [Bacteroidetes bacterium]|nr:PD40 domain-containing protein [Bacteroidota bacterium]